MIKKKKEIQELFPYKKNVDMNQLQISPVGIYSITNPADTISVLSGIKNMWMCIHCKRIANFSKLTIMDGTSSVGGDTISFAEHFKKVISIEKDIDTYNMLVNNLAVYNIQDKVKTYNTDILTILNSSKKKISIDIFYMDPPWNPPGQIWYKKLPKMMLFLSKVPVYDVIKLAFANTKCQIVTVKVPGNFDFQLYFAQMTDYLTMVHAVSNYYIILIARKKE